MGGRKIIAVRGESTRLIRLCANSDKPIGFSGKFAGVTGTELSELVEAMRRDLKVKKRTY
jgi:hypothetical protein